MLKIQGRGAIKQGLLCSLSAFPSFIKPGTRQTGLTGRFQKSFDMNNWHLLRKSENCNKRENGKRILGSMTDGRRECIFWQRVLRKCTGAKQQRKRRLKKTRQKVRMPITFVKGNYFGTPLCTTCKINRAGDKDQSLRNRGGGADTRRKGLMQDFM